MANDEHLVNPSTYWTRDGKRYFVIASDIEAKDADAANWSRGVLYQDEDATEPRRVRTQADFIAKFKPE